MSLRVQQPLRSNSATCKLLLASAFERGVFPDMFYIIDQKLFLQFVVLVAHRLGGERRDNNGWPVNPMFC